MGKYESKNAKNVLAWVNTFITEAEDFNKNRRSWEKRKEYNMSDVCERLSIFDWWVDTLSVSRLKAMKNFLEKAIARGFTGYVCFKVGVEGCAHGMWAHRTESTTGYSPYGEFLFHGFNGVDNSWGYMFPDGELMEDDGEDPKHPTRSGHSIQMTLAEIDTALVYGKNWKAYR